MNNPTPAQPRTTSESIFPQGNPDDVNSDAFRILYGLALLEGERRFGSDCKHEETKDGVCCNCMRKVV